MLDNVIKPIDTILNRTFKNVYITTSIKVFLILYAALAAPRLSPNILGLFDNTLFRITLSFIIVFMATKDVSIALLIAVAFVLTLQTANNLRLVDTSLSVASARDTSWLPSTKLESFTKNRKTSTPYGPMLNCKDSVDIVGTSGYKGPVVGATEYSNIDGTSSVNGVSSLGGQDLLYGDAPKTFTPSRYTVSTLEDIETYNRDLDAMMGSNLTQNITSTVESFEPSSPSDLAKGGAPFTTEANFNDIESNLIKPTNCPSTGCPGPWADAQTNRQPGLNTTCVNSVKDTLCPEQWVSKNPLPPSEDPYSRFMNSAASF